mgnify:CR=1 FL=1
MVIPPKRIGRIEATADEGIGRKIPFSKGHEFLEIHGHRICSSTVESTENCHVTYFAPMNAGRTFLPVAAFPLRLRRLAFKGGKCAFAAGARAPCVDGDSLHSSSHETGVCAAVRKLARSPKCRILRTARMSASYNRENGPQGTFSHLM